MKKSGIDKTIIFLAALDSEKLPRPQREFLFHTSRKWRFDFCWSDKKIALEVEGGVWTGGRHTTASGFIGDMEKYNAAAVLGWRIIRVTPKDLIKTKTINLIKLLIN